MYPIIKVDMNVTIPLDNGISLLVNPTIISFLANQTSANIPIFLNDPNKWVIGATTNIIVMPLSTYAGSANIKLIAVSPSNNITSSVSPIILA